MSTTGSDDLQSDLERCRAELNAARAELTLERAARAAVEASAQGEFRVAEALLESEARYKSMVELAPVGMAIHVGLIVEFVNSAAARMLGAASPDELLGRNVLDLVHPDDREAARARALEVSHAPGPTPLAPLRLLTLSGSVLDVETGSTAITHRGVPARQLVFTDVGPRVARDRELSRFRQAVATAGEIIFLTDLDGVFTYVNPEFTRVYGWTLEEVVGQKTPRILKNPATDPKHFASFWGALRLKSVLRGEYENRTRDGQRIHVDGSASPILHEDGQVIGYLAVQRDITARKRVDEQLQVTQYSVDHASDAVFWVEASGRFVYVNETACRSLGYTRDELLQLGIADVDPSMTPDKLAALWVELKERKSLTSETLQRTKDGHWLTMEVSANRAQIDGKELNFSFVRDISERKTLTEQLLHSQKMEALGVLAGGVAHDFNNLLSVILSYAGLVLADLEPSSPMWSDVEEIRKAGGRAAAVARQLLVFSRRDVRQTEVVDLNRVLGELEKLLRRIVGEDVRFLTLPGGGLRRVRVDPGQAEQVLVNLAVNARDAMPRGGELQISTTNLGAHSVRIEVTDTGHGMSPEIVARVFEPFFTTKEKSAGTGLGLSIVYGIVKQFGGEVAVRSAVGVGTTFTIDLPAVLGEGLEPGATAKVEPKPGRGQCVLVVEDEDAVRTIVVRMLVRSGYRTLEARNAGEALLICERPSERVDLLLTDVVMPQMSGHELAERFARVRVGVPVLFMTGYTDRAFSDVGDDTAPQVVAKPFTREELLAAVELALG